MSESNFDSRTRGTVATSKCLVFLSSILCYPDLTSKLAHHGPILETQSVVLNLLALSSSFAETGEYRLENHKQLSETRNCKILKCVWLVVEKRRSSFLHACFSWTFRLIFLLCLFQLTISFKFPSLPVSAGDFVFKFPSMPVSAEDFA